MGVRPPQQDSDEPELIEFGIAALDGRLEHTDIDFPATRAEIERVLGNVRVPYDAHGNEVTLSEALGELDQERFDSEQDLLNALHPVFERYRAQSASGIIASIRSFLPF
ncbi:MAG: hypothetical protein SVG88_09270 [Halobacteriales archaeon]|nr:hypothetical protein [Halobacteriales archaeon]